MFRRGIMKQSIFSFRFIWAVAIAVVLCQPLAAQDFEEWKKQQQSEFQAYKDKFDQEFVEMLNKTWEEVGVNLGSDLYEDKKPEDIPEFTPPPPPPKPKVDNDAPEDKVIEDKVKEDMEVELDLTPIELPPPPKPVISKPDATAANAMFDNIEAQTIKFDFFSDPIEIKYPQMIRGKINPADYRNGSVDNKKIAKFWDDVSSVNHTKFVEYTLQLKSDLGLNDWGYVLLINDISKSIFGRANLNVVRMMNWFLLTKAGYEVKVGYDQNGVYDLFTVSNNIFNTQYYTLDGNKYFPINFNEEKQTPTSIFTYSGKHEAQVKKLDLTIDSYPEFVGTNNTIKKKLTFNYKGKTYNLPVSVNKEVVAYFEYYPLTDLEVFFTASFSERTKKEMYSALKPVVSEMSEEEGVNFLLRLVQTSFEYKTDQDNFDREKYMTPDETLFYQYSDCDDRSIIFATLVRELLGLEVVGLRYSRHLAVAVHFNDTAEGDFHMYKGKKFTVADPTYINAPAGLTMTNYRNEKPKIIGLPN